jgi:hypothetical protein
MKQKRSPLNHDILSFRDSCNTRGYKKNGICRIWKQVAKIGFRDRGDNAPRILDLSSK